MAVVETQKQGDVAVIKMDNPPVNALGHAVRVGLEKAFNEANADGSVKAIVLTGTGRFFSAGADITEFKGEMKEPNLPQLIDRIEASAKPVVAAINGTALGGGLELSLGCHYRVAAKDVRQLGLPEIKLGIIPGAGGTQRLPRAIGVEQALQLITTGAFIAERQAANLPGIGSDAKLRDVETVGILGAGTMGTGITLAFLNGGFPVTIVETTQEALDRGVDRIKDTLSANAKRGRITESQAADRFAKLTPSLKMEDLGKADLIIEAVFENMALKKEVFQKLDKIAKAGAI